MITYSIVILLLWWFKNKYQYSTNSKLKGWYIVISCGIFVFLATFRDVIPLTDIATYIERYKEVSTFTIKESWEYYELGPGYYLISRLFSFTGLTYYYWLAFIQILYICGFIKLIKKFTTAIPLCLIFYFTIGLFTFSLNGLRQSLAMGLIWFALSLFLEKKWVWATILWIIAYYCHSTALIMLFAIPIYLIRNIKTYYFFIIIVLSLIAVYYQSILLMLTEELNNEHYLSYFDSEKEGYSVTTLIFYSVLILISLYSYRTHIRSFVFKKSVNRYVFALALMAVVTQIFSLSVASAFRLSLYYLPFLCILLANAIKNNVQLTRITIILVSFWLIYTSRAIPYQFMW